MSKITPPPALADEQAGLHKWMLQAERNYEQYTGQEYLEVSGIEDFSVAICAARDKQWLDMLERAMSLYGLHTATVAQQAEANTGNTRNSGDLQEARRLAERADRIAEVLEGNGTVPTMRVIEFMREAGPLLREFSAAPEAPAPQQADRLRVPIDWSQAGRLMEAAMSASSAGFTVGTTNWAAHIYREMADRQRVPGGWKLVPVEPTCDMLAAMSGEWHPSRHGKAREQYAAMLAAAPEAQAQAKEISPEFTDTARAALLWVLWHHQGGSSDVGQPIRFALGMGQYEKLNAHQVREAKRWAALNPKPTPEAPAQASAVDERAIDAAARKIAECMDYPWEHMPEKGRSTMRDHAKAVLDAARAALAQKGGDA